MFSEFITNDQTKDWIQGYLHSSCFYLTVSDRRFPLPFR